MLNGLIRHFRQNVVAYLALFFALSSPAAALVITGALVVDESLTGQDVRNGSIADSDLAVPAYAHVDTDGTIIASKGIVSVELTGGSFYCFDVAFQPHTVNADVAALFNGLEGVAGFVRGTPSSGGFFPHECPLEADAAVAALDPTGRVRQVPLFVVIH